MHFVPDKFVMIKARKTILLILALLLIFSVSGEVPAAENSAPGGLAIIKGIVRDEGGSPIADATVAIFRQGTSVLLKQVQSAADGSFLARIAPGTYSVLAVAQGYNSVTLSEVEVAQSAQLIYGFKLERAGSGNTLPEKRIDRNNPKWIRRSATLTRSIYQNSEGDAPSEQTAESDEGSDQSSRDARSVVETAFGSSKEGNYAAFNFATFLPVKENVELVIAGQTGIGAAAPQRFEAQAKYRPNDDHQFRLNGSFGRLGRLQGKEGPDAVLSQLSVSASDEWKVREGFVLVFGIDYARFVGAGSDQSINPRLGVQYDIDPKTRLHSAFTTQTEDTDWSRAIELEDSAVVFRTPVAVDDLAVVDGKPVMNRTSRFEIGFERVLDNSSSVDVNFFADTTYAKGDGFISMPLSGSFAVAEFVANQQGNAQGVSLVYRRRINGNISAAAGYSAGRGQKLSAAAVTEPADLFDPGFFQTFFGQVDADFKTGTTVKTVFRLSPEATIFAIDPFRGRLAIYDPSLSVMVSQDLPTLGLPFQAQAIVDARNLFGFQTGVSTEEGTLRLNGQGRTLRGGILVRF